jgi:hypothetical protein
MSEQPSFWFVEAHVGKEHVGLAVAAFTERSARVQARKRIGRDAVIAGVSPVRYAHAWVINFGWRLSAVPGKEA